MDSVAYDGMCELALVMLGGSALSHSLFLATNPKLEVIQSTVFMFTVVFSSFLIYIF